MSKAIICEHGLATSKCKPCRSARLRASYKENNPNALSRQLPGVICEHGLPISKCRPCYRPLRNAQSKEQRERNREDILRRRRFLYHHSDVGQKTRDRAAASWRRNKNNAEWLAGRNVSQAVYALLVPRKERGRAEKELAKAYNDKWLNKSPDRGRIRHRHTNALRWSKNNDVPYSLFYRCKDCKRSTPNVDKYCDEHRDVYEALQFARELYKLTKLQKKVIHHERHKECDHERSPLSDVESSQGRD